LAGKESITQGKREEEDLRLLAKAKKKVFTGRTIKRLILGGKGKGHHFLMTGAPIV